MIGFWTDQNYFIIKWKSFLRNLFTNDYHFYTLKNFDRWTRSQQTYIISLLKILTGCRVLSKPIIIFHTILVLIILPENEP